MIGAYPNNLPLQLNRFIGREQAMEEIKRTLWSTRLLTLTGPGGCGKTRLAVQVAAELLDAFSDGVWLIELASLADAALIARTIMKVLDMREQPGRTPAEALSEQLRPRELLLVLDNSEHLIDGCAALAMTLLQRCPGLRILATSREALNVAAEIAWPVPPLSMIDPQWTVNAAALQTSEAACLFLDRATAAQADFAVSDQTAPAIEQICRRLDGMPLAIELAAARVKVLAVDQIAARLDNRFNLLSIGSRSAPARHQTLRAMIDWSYGLLSATEKILFRRLAVFAGGWTLEAAEAACADERMSAAEVLPALSRLVDKSIVMADKTRDEARYRLLETIRQYAHEKLAEAGEVDRIRERHLAYFVRWSETTKPHLSTAAQLVWLNRYEADHDNLRAALDWCQAHAHLAEAGLRLAAACQEFWRLHGYASEGRARSIAALAQPGAQPHTATRARALTNLASLTYLQSDFAAMQKAAEEALSIWRELGQAGQSGAASMLNALGDIATEAGDYDRAAVLLQEAMQLFREVNDIGGISQTHMELGWAAMRSGDYPLAASHLEDYLALARQVGDPTQVALALSGLGEVAIRQGQYDRAVSWLEQSLALNRESEHKWGIGTVLGSLGWVALRQRNFKRARELLGESLSIRMETGDQGGMTWCLEKLAQAAHRQGRPETAAKIFGAAAALRALLGSAIDLADRAEYERILAELRSALGDSAFTANWAQGEALSLTEAIDEALAEPDKPSRSETQADQEKYRGLSSREREVAALVAQGKANREIAQALLVELKTVESHITHILNKLGFDNRVQIATWAVNRGLAPPPEV
jgi:predicted ATPase/DNA-binding CsgD family transcriptional regulator